MPDPRMLALTQGLPDLPGSSVAQSMPPPPPQPDAAPPYNPMEDPSFRAFVADRARQLNELKGAQAQVAATRGAPGTQVGNFLSRLGGTPESDIQLQYQRMGQPVTDVLQRQQAGRDITQGGVQQQQLESTARQNQLAVMAQDPRSPMSRRVQMMFAPILGPIAQHLTAADAEMALKTGTAGGDLVAKLAEAAKARSEAGKIGAETAQVAPNAASARALQGAQTTQAQAGAEKEAAEAAHTRMLTSGEVVPGYTRGTTPIDEGTQGKLNEQYKDYVGSRDALDEIIKIVGDKDFIADPNKRAALQPRLAELTGQLRSSVGMRSLAGPEMEFAKKLIADPTSISLSNLVGFSKNAERLKSAKSGLDQHWKSTVKAYDLRGGEKPSANTSSATTKGKDGKDYSWNGKGWVAAK